MKLATFFTALACAILLGVCIGVIGTIKTYQDEIDLPEEYTLISRDLNAPDTLLGVIDSEGKLIITFKKNY